MKSQQAIQPAMLRHLFCFLSCLGLCVPMARADWINLTGAETAPNIAEIYILDDHVKVVLEVYVGDLETFEELVPDSWMKEGGKPRPALADRMRGFSQTKLRFTTDTGASLPARLALVEPRMRVDRQSPFAGMINPMTRQRVPEAPADKRVLYAEIIYPFKQRPKTLTIVPPVDEEGRALVTIGFITYHKAVPVIDFRYLGADAKLELNWADPWYSKFDNPNLKRHHRDAMMSYLYVEPFEVRHEILTRVKDMAEWMDLGLRGDEYIEVDELEPLKQRIGEFLIAKNPVLVDGKELRPVLDRTNYVTLSLQGIRIVEKPQRMDLSTAIVGVIITYLTESLPQEVTCDWELFSDRIQRVPATSVDPAGPLLSFVTPDDNVHTWTNFLKKYQEPTVEAVAVSGSLGELRVPVGTLLCIGALLPLGWQIRRNRRNGKSLLVPVSVFVVAIIGAVALYPHFAASVPKPAAVAGALPDERAQQLLQSLMKNVYRAFDFRREDDVYDKLAMSVSGDLLSDIYLQNRKSFAVQQAGGVQAKIKEVEVLQAGAERVGARPLTYAITGKWSAMGTVGHWGHVHMRKNLYEAIVTIANTDGRWKITGLEILDESRVQPQAATATAVPQ
ncbi:MAG: hypothetical protein JSU95_07280 [Betaproteobacteria bacterium]|nr:MAG: hypothetical protein JSU95_07280 [Betaproteobacteria bacterium]